MENNQINFRQINVSQKSFIKRRYTPKKEKMDLKEAVKFQNLKDLMLKKQRCGNHELVLDIGLKALKISEDWIIYRVMGCSSFQLERYKDAIKFFKQQLKLVTKVKDAGVLQQLLVYRNLINAQCRDKDYQAAMKTCRKVKIFNLNSENVQDVQLEMLRARFSSFLEDKEVCKSQIPMILESYQTFLLSVWICLMKIEIFTALDIPDLACDWLDATKKIICEKQICITADKNDALIFYCEIDISKGATVNVLTSVPTIVKSCFKSNELGELMLPERFIFSLLKSSVMVGIISWEYMDKHFASPSEISASQKLL